MPDTAKDFYYDSSGKAVEPLVLSFCFGDTGSVIHFKFDENLNRKKITETLTGVFNKIDPVFLSSQHGVKIFTLKSSKV